MSADEKLAKSERVAAIRAHTLACLERLKTGDCLFTEGEDFLGESISAECDCGWRWEWTKGKGVTAREAAK